MAKHQFKILLICVIVSAASIFFILKNRGQEPKEPPKTPPIVRADPGKETMVTSSDGKWTLKMMEEKGRGDVTFSFLNVSSVDGSQKEIYRKTLPLGSSLSIPANTFSPDDKYLFLKEKDSGGDKYLVFSTSGGPIGKDTDFYEISGLFTAKYPNYKITDVTGWGGVNLIVFNTDKVEGGFGPSFWFDVPSHSFIQLTNRFN